ncbi:hypothetical protein LEP1GSC188_1919 [Leptospira weilii serovar Topaz str. LT2116]|uniref:Uncharacterized protein n=1 Tax=Leptospira weilii serovar Topaz str. LT2116 TaxID=1088540 RepID=M3GBT8_9LEPT|nr:hypothetical protein LEP1GSC188_1919 [Leptospira weilii serovar Topaz str. LT2116]
MVISRKVLNEFSIVLCLSNWISEYRIDLLFLFENFNSQSEKFYDHTVLCSKDKILSKPSLWQKIYQGMSEKLESEVMKGF